MRREAVREMLRAVDAADRRGAALAPERRRRDTGVRADIRDGLALADLDSDDADTRLAAVKTLAGSLNLDVYNRLTSMAEQASDGSYGESDAAGARGRADLDPRDQPLAHFLLPAYRRCCSA